jgi:RimJ/RimL family protein N-acetyltransferase
LIDRNYWGQGLATEIARASLKFGFEVRQFDKVVAMTRHGNAASRHILEKKLGMRFSGEMLLFGIQVVGYYITQSQYVSNGNS